MDLRETIQNKAGELLEKGEIDCFIGYEKGRLSFRSPPVFIENLSDARRLVWDEFCTANLSKYLIKLPGKFKKVGLIVKGCDSRGLAVLLQEKQVKREDLVIVGVHCPGMKDIAAYRLRGDQHDLPAASKCAACSSPSPVIYDFLFGEKNDRLARDRFAEVEALENISVEGRYKFWEGQFAACIRCYACRNICPACYCPSCYIDQQAPGWHGKGAQMADNANYILTRAMHVAGRCIECGECERVCPQQIPLMLIHKKLIREMQILYQGGDAGLTPEAEQPLCCYSITDPDEFM